MGDNSPLPTTALAAGMNTFQNYMTPVAFWSGAGTTHGFAILGRQTPNPEIVSYDGIQIRNQKVRIVGVKRGIYGTIASSHKKGDIIELMDGFQVDLYKDYVVDGAEKKKSGLYNYLKTLGV